MSLSNLKRSLLDNDLKAVNELLLAQIELCIEQNDVSPLKELVAEVKAAGGLTPESMSRPSKKQKTAHGVSSVETDPIVRVEKALGAIKRGELVVVMDDEDRENEGDLIMAAEMATPEKIAFMVNHTSGVICTPLEASRITELDLPQMVINNTESHQTAFTVSVDHISTSTGISAADRAATIVGLATLTETKENFNKPGHIFPLRARENGVLTRKGHTEAAVDLARLAGLQPAGVICEITNRDGTMSRYDDCLSFAQTHKLAFVTIDNLIQYRKAKSL